MRHVILIILLSSCYSVSEHNAIEWVHQAAPARPIHSVSCQERDLDGDRWVRCDVLIEDVGRLFPYKLKCFNSAIGLAPFKARCIEVLDE
jgi:hypothetical protein